MDNDIRRVLLHRLYQHEPSESDREREKKLFGMFMRQWRIRNGWTQYTWGKYAKDLGFSFISYGNLSVLENGTCGNLRWDSFWQIGRLNFSFFSQEWKNDKIENDDVRQRIARTEPIAIYHDDGIPWLASDFMLAFHGFIDFPWDVEAEEERLKSVVKNQHVFEEADALMYLGARGFKLVTKSAFGGIARVLKRKHPIKRTELLDAALSTLTREGYSHEFVDAETGRVNVVFQAFPTQDAVS
jgi:hypothetical protein